MSLKRICVKKEKMKCPKIPHCPKIPVMTLVRYKDLVVWKKRQIRGLVILSLSCTVLSDEPLSKKSTVMTLGVHRTGFSPYLSQQFADINE